MTVKQQIVDFLETNRPEQYTNSQLSRELAIPEPSVRRATKELDRSMRIQYAGTASYSTGAVKYEANPA